MEDLARFFMQRNMAFEPVSQGAISSAFATTLPDGQEQTFSLFVLPLEDAFGDKYVRFTVVPFIEAPAQGYPDNLGFEIGQINHDLPQLKLAFDPDGDLELLLDVPADALDDARFDHTLQVLADYAGAYWGELTSQVG